MWDPYGEFQTATLPNGLTVHVAHWPNRPWESVGFIIHSGAEQDPVGLEGTAHFVEHLVSANAKMSVKEISALFEDRGGSVNLGSTGYDCTQYKFFAPVDEGVILKAFSLFGQMLLAGKLEKDVEKERQIIIGEYCRTYKMQFAADLEIRERKALYNGYWVERYITPLGAPDSVKLITQSDLQKYYDAHYTPANISIVCVGGMKLTDIMQLLSKGQFSMDIKGTRNPLPNFVGNIEPPSENRYLFEVSKHLSTDIPMVTCSYRSVTVIPKEARSALNILKSMLSEILDDEVRQSRAWTYDINTRFCNRRQFYEFAINCDSLKLEGLETIEGIIEACIASLVDREDLFLQEKRRYIVNNQMVDLNGKKVCSDALDDLAIYHRIISLEERIKSFEATIMDDVRDLLYWLRPERRWTIIRKP